MSHNNSDDSYVLVATKNRCKDKICVMGRFKLGTSSCAEILPVRPGIISDSKLPPQLIPIFFENRFRISRSPGTVVVKFFYNVRMTDFVFSQPHHHSFSTRPPPPPSAFAENGIKMTAIFRIFGCKRSLPSAVGARVRLTIQMRNERTPFLSTTFPHFPPTAGIWFDNYSENIFSPFPSSNVPRTGSYLLTCNRSKSLT